MAAIIQCVPNFSEGRDPAVMEAIVTATRGASAARVVDWSADPDHHRMVVTIVGDPESVLHAAFAGAREAVRRIDLTRHVGEHPRMGAVDVIPLVPLVDIELDDLVPYARRLAARMVMELQLPVYFYEAAATRPGRANLAAVRQARFEGMCGVPLEGDLEPDLGPLEVHPTAGAVAIGVRGPLIAFNVNLATDDLEIARAVARQIRERDGGLPGVKALGMRLESKGLVQVSCNITQPTVTPVYQVVEAVRSAAGNYGVGIAATELIGCFRTTDLLQAARHYMANPELRLEQVLDWAGHWAPMVGDQ